MKSLFATLLCAAMAVAPAPAETPFVNLTPAPKSISQADGVYVLPKGLTVGTAGLDADMAAEVDKFVASLNAATSLGAAAVADGAADISVARVASVAPEGYNLTVTTEGVAVEASTPAGLYFAFQTIRKVLPSNVMALKPGAADAVYSLPLITVSDEPAYEYRGLMLDVCRHFFTVDEVKRMIDVMSYYKMNAFHWHLTEDQGWRMEVPSWPRLTTVGASVGNVRLNDWNGTKEEYWTNRPAGPNFYTVEQMKDVVAYAAERHITVIPEVEFPGHACAAVTAYPELSCWPDGAHSVKTDGGVYNDVLNVAEPKTLRFAKDVIDVLCEVFPSELIQLGGDECPTGAWQNNALCQAKVRELGLQGDNDEQKYRKLQNWFTLQLAEYAATKGRRIGCWNESVTAGGADLGVMKQTGATIWCWTGPDNAVNVATDNGLRAVYTPYSSQDGKQYDGTPTSNTKGSFYINRKQDPDDAPANGNSWDTVDKTYMTSPFTDSALRKHPELCYGVQGTFWTERVDDIHYVEWLALPRLIAVAEVGWTPGNRKNFADFIARVKADLPMLDLNGYRYSPYFLENAIVNYTFTCTDTEGNTLLTHKHSLSGQSTDLRAVAPQIRNFTLKSLTVDGTDVACVYERTGATVVSRSVLPNGVLVDITEQDYPLGTEIQVSSLVPDAGEFFSYSSSNINTTSFAVTADMTVEHSFTTSATHFGVSRAAGAIEPAAGKVCLIHDSHSSRSAFRCATTSAASKVSGEKIAVDLSPYFTWELEENGQGFAIRNLGNDKYVQRVTNNTQGTLGKTPRDFVITRRDDGCYTIKNSTNDQAWDGQDNLNMVGWAAPGHPMEFMEFVGKPMFRVTVSYVDTEGKSVRKAVSEYADAGKAFTLELPEIKGYSLKSVAGNEGLGHLAADAEITVTYESDENSIADVEAAGGATSEIYDLQGHRLVRVSRPGIYIINGHKTLVR